MSIDEVLAQRGAVYGDFLGHARISQQIKAAILERGVDAPSYVIEALEMIAHKLARVANGDPLYRDNWVDIAGYAQLVVHEIDAKKAEEDRIA